MDQKEVISNLRACLLCAKGGVSIDSLSQDYRTLVCEPIPFKKLGYTSLVAFLQAVPGIRAFDKGGQCFIEAIPTQESAHLSKLVRQQKTSSKKSKKGRKVYSTSSPRKPVTVQAPKSIIKQINSAARLPNVTQQQQIIYPGKSTMQQNKDSTNVRNPPANTGQTRLYAAIGTKSPPSEKPSQYYQKLEHTPPQYHQKSENPPQHHPKSENPSQHYQKPEYPLQYHSKSEQLPQYHLKPEHLAQYHPKPEHSPQYHPKSEHLPQYHPKLEHPPQYLSKLENPSQYDPKQENPRQYHSIPENPPQYHKRPENLQVSISNVNTIPTRVVVTTPIVDPRLQLLTRTAALHLPEPVYSVLPTKIKNTKSMSVFAQVKIGTYGYRSYPKEAESTEDAEKIAAEVALQDLTEKYGLPDNIAQTENKNVVMQRIMRIVDNHPNGVFMHQVPVLYRQEHKELPPTDWETIIKNCSSLTLEKGVDNSYILRPVVQAPKTPRTPEKDKSLSFFKPLSPGSLQFPDDNLWIVYVTHVGSTTEIWGRLIDDTYNEKFAVLTAEMMEHYSKIQTPTKAPPIQVGNYYALFQDDSWNRVRCIEHNQENGTVTVSFIDFGDKDEVNYCRLQSLDKKFCSLPAQAFRLKLASLEEFSDCESVVPEITKCLLDKTLYAEIKSRDTIDGSPVMTVIFYDTSGPTDINLYTVLSKRLMEHVAKPPRLDMDRKVFEVFVSHIETNGDVYIQIQSESMKLLIKLLGRLISESLSNLDPAKQRAVSNTNATKVYFVFVDGSWYRATIVQAASVTQFKVFLIDYGKTVTVEQKNMILLEQFSDLVAKYPPQALKVHLHNIDNSMFHERMVMRLNELAPEGEPLLAKVVKSSPNEVPTVELLKRIPPSNLLASINNTLMYGDELSRSQGDDNNNNKPRKRVELLNAKLSNNEDVNIGRVLKPPKISPIGEFFNVHVTMAAHPGNFTVQPYDESNALTDMMNRLQEVYRSYDGPIPTVRLVKEGQIYAVEHKGHWYRVRISDIIMDDMVTVYFCDFGDVSVLRLDKLRPLKSEFYELPYQAIKAKLVGIRPVNVDWSVEDCLRFQEMVVEQDFASLVVESEPDGVSPADTILGLKLINVSTSEDIYIDQMLVDEGRAEAIEL